MTGDPVGAAVLTAAAYCASRLAPAGGVRALWLGCMTAATVAVIFDVIIKAAELLGSAHR